jgi:HipA-like kinase
MATIATSQSLPRAAISTVTARYVGRTMSGQSSAHLMYCSDESFYVVKSAKHLKEPRALASEMLATLMALWLGLPFPPLALVEVPDDLCSNKCT